MVAPQSMSRGRGRGRPGRPVDRAVHRRAGRLGDPALDLGDDLAHDEPGRAPGRLGHHPVEADQRRRQVDVRLHRVEQLGLQQQRGQVEPLDRVALQDLDDRGREVRRGCRRASARPTGPTRPARPGAASGRPRPRVVGVVQRGERPVHLLLVGGQAGLERLLGRLAEQQPPPAVALGRGSDPFGSAAAWSLVRLSHGGPPRGSPRPWRAPGPPGRRAGRPSVVAARRGRRGRGVGRGRGAERSRTCRTCAGRAAARR